jgi:hypothetical protein
MAGILAPLTALPDGSKLAAIMEKKYEEYVERCNATYVNRETGELYEGGDPTGILCPTCNELFTEHSVEQLRVCSNSPPHGART